MKLTAALCWYDEKVEDLEACVKGAANVADHFLAVDGAYRRYPNAKPSSPPEQAEAIRAACKSAGMTCEIWTPEDLWAGQVEKRSALLELASARNPNWIALLDADHIIHTDRLWARGTLNTLVENPDIDVLAVSYLTPANDSRPIEQSAATNWHTSLSGTRTYVPHILRVLPKMRVERFHWWYSAEKLGERVWLWGEGDQADGARSLQWFYIDPERYTVEHRCLERDERHVLENRAFCNDRVKVVAATGQEDDVPGLPAPEFDYESMPY